MDDKYKSIVQEEIEVHRNVKLKVSSSFNNHKNSFLNTKAALKELRAAKLALKGVQKEEEYEDEEDELAWNRVLSPGTEEFIKFEDNVVVTNYWIDQQEYYTKVTYTLIDDQNMKAEFNGKLKGEFYYGIINYKRVNINPKTKHEN